MLLDALPFVLLMFTYSNITSRGESSCLVGLKMFLECQTILGYKNLSVGMLHVGFEQKFRFYDDFN